MANGERAAARLSLPTILTFSATNLPVAALVVGVSIFLQPYIAVHLGVGLTMVGLAWGAVRLIDIPIEPILGVSMDRTRTRLGRYRVWMLIGAPILMLGVYLLFMAPKGIGMPYLIGGLLVMYLGISILSLSHSAWGAVLATHYDERSRLFGILAAVGVLGSLVVLAIPALVHGGARKAPELVPIMGWFVIFMTPLCVGIVTWRTPEKISVDAPGRASQFAFKDYLALASNPTMVRLFLGEMALVLGPGWMSVLYLFFFRDSRGFTTAQASLLLGCYVVSGVVGAPTTGWIATKLGKHRTLMAATTAYSVGLCCVLLAPKGQFLAAMPVMFWCGFMASGFGLMIRAMTADFGDQIRLEQGKERISLIYALLSLATKIAGAMSALLSYPLLDAVGYHAKEGMKNTPEAIRHLELIYLAGPIFFVMIGGACFIGWRLDAARHDQIRGELEARDALYDEAPVLASLGVEPAIAVADDAGV